MGVRTPAIDGAICPPAASGPSQTPDEIPGSFQEFADTPVEGPPAKHPNARIFGQTRLGAGHAWNANYHYHGFKFVPQINLNWGMSP